MKSPIGLGDIYRAVSPALAWLPPRWHARGIACAGRLWHSVTNEESVVAVEFEETFTWVKASDGDIAIANPRRIRWYTHGLQHRLRGLRERYSLEGVASCTPNDQVLDVGANIGEYTMAISPWVKRVVAVEPDPLAALCLQRNVHALHNVTICNDAAWRRNEMVDFFLSSAEADSSTIMPPEGGRIIKKRGRMLDSVCEELAFTPTFLKMDAEGGEPEVLEGAVEILSTLRAVAIDCGPERQGMRTDAAVQDILRGHGFTTHVAAKGLSVDVVFGWRGTSPESVT